MAEPPSLSLSPANEKRALLFNVGSPFEVPMKEFDEHWWPLITNVWTECSHYKSADGNFFWKTFSCRFAKRTKSSSRKEGVVPDKRRKTKIRLAGICSSRIKISHDILSQMVQITRFQSSPDHTHSLRESDQLKRPQAIRRLIETEAIKNYSPPAIVRVVKEHATTQLGLAEAVHGGSV